MRNMKEIEQINIAFFAEIPTLDKNQMEMAKHENDFN